MLFGGIIFQFKMVPHWWSGMYCQNDTVGSNNRMICDWAMIDYVDMA